MIRALLTLAALVLLAVPAPAAAQTSPTNAPPGNSAIDEYLETVPAATGDQRPGTPPAAGGSNAGGTLTPSQRSRLEALGPDGKSLADAVDATAPARPKATTPIPTAEGRSPLSEVVNAAVGRDGGGGMGSLLPAILLATVLGFVALVVLRRRAVS